MNFAVIFVGVLVIGALFAHPLFIQGTSNDKPFITSINQAPTFQKPDGFTQVTRITANKTVSSRVPYYITWVTTNI
jgi:hypothetical protein